MPRNVLPNPATNFFEHEGVYHAARHLRDDLLYRGAFPACVETEARALGAAIDHFLAAYDADGIASAMRSGRQEQ